MALSVFIEDAGKRDLAPTELLADTLYGSDDNVEKAKELGIAVIAPVMGAKESATALSDFTFSDTDQIIACPEQQSPVKTKSGKQGGTTVYFDKAVCDTCRRQSECPIKRGKKSCTISYDAKSLRLSRRRRREKEAAFAEKYRYRSGIEGTMSDLDRIYALLIFLMQRQILYPGRYIRVNGPPPVGIIPIGIVTSDGRNEAWFMPPFKRRQGERRPLVIFFHGNGEVINYLPEQVEGFRELGMGVLLVEYPGFGLSFGQLGEKSITETAVAAYDAALQREEVDPARVVLFGRSLGSGAACALAARRPSAALILQSAFTSTRPFACRFLVPGFLVRDLFDNGGVVAAYRQPILLFHGSQDTIIPPEHSRELHRLAPHARLVEFSCGHNDFPPDWREFYRVIAVFLKDSGVLFH